ncbi:MAG: purine-binding chemotaxis protein CheW [Epulopiscium sp.]|nr:purine-binding chemotaxis protein CheW [Candidatus Epulonipiscium sp.]
MRQIVVFKLGKEEYGIDIIKVVEIVHHQEIRKVPETPNYIEGIVNLRGDIYPIYNLRTRFNMKSEQIDEDTKIIIIKGEETDVGFIVDNVSEILNISESEIEDAPSIIASRTEQEYISGVAKEEGRMIVLLDIDKLVSDSDQNLIKKMLEE